MVDLAGFQSSIDYTDTDDVDEPAKDTSLYGFQSSVDYADENEVQGEDGRVAANADNAFEPMPKGWNEGEDSYPLGEYGDALRRRDWEVMQTNKERTKGIDFQAGWQEFTKGYVGKAVDTIDYLIMKPVLSTVGEAMNELGGVVASSLDAGDGSVAFDNETASQVRGYVKENAEELGKWWMTLDKNTRKNIEGAGLLASIMPASFATKPVQAVARETARGIKGAKSMLKASLAKEKSKSSLEMIKLPKSRMNVDQKFKHQKNTDAGGKYTPDADELAEMKAVESIPEFKTKNSKGNRDWAINKGVKDQSEALEVILKKDGTIIDPEMVRQSMDSSLDAKVYQNTVFAGALEEGADGQLNSIIKTMRAKAETAMTKALKENDGVMDSLTLNRARQSFDNSVTKEKLGWTSDNYSMNDEVWKAVRKGMNDVIDDSSINRTVKSRRESVSRLISARDNSNIVMQEEKGLQLYQKAFHAISGVGRTQYLGQILANAAAASGAVALAGGLKAGISISAVAGASGFGLAWVGGKMVMSRAGRKTALAIVSELDSAMKLAKTAAQKVAISKAKKDMINLISTSTIVSGGVAARNAPDDK